MHHDNNPSLPDPLPEDLTTDASPPVSSSPSPETATGAVGRDQITDNSPQATWLDDVNLDLPISLDHLNHVARTLRPPLEAIQWLKQSTHQIHTLMETAFRPLVDIRPTLALAPNLTSFVSRDITLLSAAVQPMVDVRSALTSPQVVLKGSSLSLPFSTSFQEIHSALNALPSAATLLTQVDLGFSGLSFLALPPALPDIRFFSDTLLKYCDRLGDIASSFSASLALPFIADMGLLSEVLPGDSWFGDVISSLNTSLVNIPALIFPALKSFGERFRQRILAAFERAKLFLAPSMSEDLMNEVVYWAEAGDLRPVTLAVWRYYALNGHARLKKAIGEWRDNPEYVARWHIIEPAFTAHQKGYYASSIRTLAPEVEGIASHVVVRNTLNGIRNKKEGLHLGATESVILRMLTVAGKIPELDKNGDLTHWLRMKSLVRYVEDIFCKRVDFEGQYNRIRSTSELNRHGISHGIQLGAFTHMNSLRLFLLLDAIHYILQGYIATGGTV